MKDKRASLSLLVVLVATALVGWLTTGGIALDTPARPIRRRRPLPLRAGRPRPRHLRAALPAHPCGYDTECTVDTPGSADRGARRVVAGQDGDFNHADDRHLTISRTNR